MGLVYVIFCISTILFAATECTFPKCQDILTGSDGQTTCWSCATERMAQECKEKCQALGCNNQNTTTNAASTTSSSISENNKVNDVVNTNEESSEKSAKKKAKAKGRPEKKHKKGGKNKSKDSGEGSSNPAVSNTVVKSQCDGITPCIPLEDANSKFKQCCKQKEIKRTCWDKCKYDVTKKELQEAFLHDQCALSESRDYLYCAANNKDNSQCCKKTNVLDGERSICEPFCNPGSNQFPDKAQAKYLNCFVEFDQIMKCHWAGRQP